MPRACLTLCNAVDGGHGGSLSMDSPGREYWSELPIPPPGIFPTEETEPMLPVSPVMTGRFFTTEQMPAFPSI